jgi:hypothetical protein
MKEKVEIIFPISLDKTRFRGYNTYGQEKALLKVRRPAPVILAVSWKPGFPTW